MHDSTIFPEVRDALLKRRGRVHLHDSFDPARTALVVVDMQNAFVAPGAVMEVAEAREVVPNINRLAAGLRAAGGTVMWVVSTYSEAALAEWPTLCGGIMPDAAARTFVDNLKAGAEGHKLYDGLETSAGDLRCEKDRYSAFLPSQAPLGASDAERRLRGRGIDTLLITGTVTQVCCESTARDAQMRNFNVVMVADGNASYSEMLHRASLSTFALSFGDVMTTEEVLARLAGAGGGQDTGARPEAAE